MKNKAGIIILNWNGEKLLREFLPSVLRNTSPELGRVIVADNASTDASVQILRSEFPEVELICFSENHGFAGGYNRAIEAVEADIVVLLNSDVEVGEGWLTPLLATLEQHPDVAAVQPKIKAFRDKSKFEYAGAAGGYIDSLGFPFCRGRILEVTEEDYGQYDSLEEVFWCSGAALCIRKYIYMEMGGLDERFFAHMEEIDLCWRIRNGGYSLKVNPFSVVYHLGGGSLPMDHPKKLFLNYRNNLLMLYKNLDKKHCRRVMFWRQILDLAAMLVFLLKGQGANARAVISAHREYRLMKKKYSRPLIGREDPCIYKGSIILNYYLRRISTYSFLPK